MRRAEISEKFHSETRLGLFMTNYATKLAAQFQARPK